MLIEPIVEKGEEPILAGLASGGDGKCSLWYSCQ